MMSKEVVRDVLCNMDSELLDIWSDVFFFGADIDSDDTRKSLENISKIAKDILALMDNPKTWND